MDINIQLASRMDYQIILVVKSKWDFERLIVVFALNNELIPLVTLSYF